MKFALKLAFLTLPLMAASPPPAAAPRAEIAITGADQNEIELMAALVLIHQHKPAEALVTLDRIIVAYESAHTSGQFRCARDMSDAIAVGIESIADAKGSKVTVLSRGWCMALWAKGFVLIDLGQTAAAEAPLARAVAMAPTNVQYRNEYAELFKARREWQRSYNLFAEAWNRSSHDPKAYDARQAARSLRGMAYAKTEMGDLADAERLLRQSLDINPGDEKSQRELDYVTRMKASRG